jgi:hypothetical protein
VDLLLLGDGYTAGERGKFERDARRLMEVLFTYSPFKERRNDFNVWGLVPPAQESGVSRPSTGTWKASPLRTAYDTFGSERYVLTLDNRTLREVASQAPYEFVEILVNSNTYGGGGIHNLYSTVAAQSRWAPYLFIHEFGHHFAALADEYYTSPTAYAPAPTDRPEPWERNVTTLKDVKALKWKELVTPGVPLPTPWQKARFEELSREFQKKRAAIRKENRPEAEMDALFLEQQRVETALFRKEEHAHAVGAFEGAHYEARGYYRPQLDCVMFSRNPVPFCQVCQRAIDEVITQYAGQPKGKR